MIEWFKKKWFEMPLLMAVVLHAVVLLLGLVVVVMLFKKIRGL